MPEVAEPEVVERFSEMAEANHLTVYCFANNWWAIDGDGNAVQILSWWLH